MWPNRETPNGSGSWVWTGRVDGCRNPAPKVLSVSNSVRTDPAGLAERIQLQDSSSWHFRWIEIPRVPGDQRIGPTDSRILILASRRDSTLQMDADSGSKVHGEIDIPSKVADSLLPYDLWVMGHSDSGQWVVRDTLRRVPFTPMAWYGEGVAVRIGRSLLIEFDSH